jgi:hypothetical protein
MNAQRWIAMAMLAVLVVIVATSSLWLPLIKNRKSSHPTPTPEATAATATPEPTQGFVPILRGTQTVVPTLDPVVIALMQEAGLKALGVGQNPVIVLGGEFTVVDDLHRASGTASVYKLGDKNRVLRLDPFEVTNGPDLWVFLSQTVEPRTSADALLPTYVNLGNLKLAEGAQNYDIPIGVNLDLYKSVVIYSTSLNLVFSSAPLEQVRG